MIIKFNNELNRLLKENDDLAGIKAARSLIVKGKLGSENSYEVIIEDGNQMIRRCCIITLYGSVNTIYYNHTKGTKVHGVNSFETIKSHQVSQPKVVNTDETESFPQSENPNVIVHGFERGPDGKHLKYQISPGVYTRILKITDKYGPASEC